MSGFTMAWRAILRFFGFGKKRSSEQDGESESTPSTQKNPPRHHPYDEVSKDQLEQKRAGVKGARTHPYDEVSKDQLEQKRAGVKGARTHPYDEVSEDQLEQKRAGVKGARIHPYDEVSEDQLEQKRAGVKGARTHPYDEVSEDQLEQKRAGAKGPRIHPYDEVSDAVLKDNRQKAKPRNHAYDEVDLTRTMSKIKEENGGGGCKSPLKKKISANSDLNYVEVDIQPESSGSEKRRVTQVDSTNYVGVRRNSAGQTVLLSE